MPTSGLNNPVGPCQYNMQIWLNNQVEPVSKKKKKKKKNRRCYLNDLICN